MARILIVDDDADMRLALRNVLAREGHTVSEAPNGENALDWLGRETPDLILLDIRLPGLDGVQTLRRIREMKRDVPVIMITGYGSVETAVELMKLGANHYLQKPFDNQQLMTLVNKTLEVPASVQDIGVLRRSLLTKLGVVPQSAPPEEPRGGLRRASPPPPATGPAKAMPSAPSFRAPGSSRRASAPPPPPAPGEEAQSIPVVPVLLVLIGLVAGGFWLKSRGPSVDNRDFSLPSKNPSGLAWSAEGLWVADWANESVVELDRSLAPGRIQKIKGFHPTGMGIYKELLYTCDSWKRFIDKRKLDKDLTILEQRQTPGPSCSAVFMDGTNLWSADSEEGRIYLHDAKTLEAKLFYPAPAKAPIGIYVDGDIMWTADADTRLIYKHKIAPGLPVLEAYGLPSLSDGNAPLSAFTKHDKHFWLARDGMALLFKRHPSTFEVSKP